MAESAGSVGSVVSNHNRKCRDLLFLVCFLFFWAGMLFVASAAFERGRMDRLVYGVDSYGNTCGSTNNWNAHKGPDFTKRKKLYFVDPTDVVSTDVSSLLRAKRVCLETCPGKDEYCTPTKLKHADCMSSKLHVCPYYRISNMYNHLPEVRKDMWGTNSEALWRTDYFDSLRTADKCPTDIPKSIEKYVQAATAKVGYSCGVAWQYLSHVPGQGPCYPVLSPTVDVLNKCVPDVRRIASSPAAAASTCDDLKYWTADFDTTKCDADCATKPCKELDRNAQCGGCKSGVCFPCSKATTTTAAAAATTNTTARRRLLQTGSVIDVAAGTTSAITTTTTTAAAAAAAANESIATATTTTATSAVNSISDIDVNAYLDRLRAAIKKLDRLQEYAADASRGVNIIIVTGIIGGVVFSVVWMTLMRFCAGVIIWGTLILINVTLGGVATLCAAKAGMLPDKAMQVGNSFANTEEGFDPQEEDRQTFEYLTYATGGIAAVVLLFTLVLASRIRVAIATLKVAAQAIAAMPNVLLYPLIPFVLYVGLVVYWVVVSGYLFSAGKLVETRDDVPPPGRNGTSVVGNTTYVYDMIAEPVRLTHYYYEFDNRTTFNATTCAEDPSCYYGYTWDKDLQYMAMYNLFGLLWTTQFLAGVTYVTLAGALSSFYWSSGEAANMPRRPLIESMYRCVRYHLGSIALGSFIVACVQFFRIMLEYIDRKTKDMQEGNFILRYCMSCVKCLMAYLECILKFINRNAYIIVAVEGVGYCSAAGTAVKLIITNAVTLAAVNFAGDGLIAIGRLIVVAACACCALSMADQDVYTEPVKYPETYLKSPLVPVLLSCLAAYVIASQFLAVYEMAVDTVLLSFCQDCDRNNGSPSCAPPLLLLAIGKARKGKTGGTSKVSDSDGGDGSPPRRRTARTK
ncbi:choline transporter protein [Pycnococcus provasolii]